MSLASSSLWPVASCSRPFRSARTIPRRSFAPSPPQGRAYTGSSASIDVRILQGVDGFLPKSNMDRICTWQDGLWLRLQDEVRSGSRGILHCLGTDALDNPALLAQRQKWNFSESSGFKIHQLIAASAKSPATSLAFNYASLVLNNSFFLEGLVSSP